MRLLSSLSKGVVLMAMFQMPSAPPMKAGLWESTTALTIHMPEMKGAERPPIMSKTRSCVTAGSWATAFANSGREAACTRLNEKYVQGKMSFDLNCPNVGSTGHVEMSFEGTTGHGRVHLDMKPAGHAVSSDMSIQSRYVGAACGAVAPGKPVVVP